MDDIALLIFVFIICIIVALTISIVSSHGIRKNEVYSDSIVQTDDILTLTFSNLSKSQIKEVYEEYKIGTHVVSHENKHYEIIKIKENRIGGVTNISISMKEK